MFKRCVKTSRVGGGNVSGVKQFGGNLIRQIWPQSLKKHFANPGLYKLYILRNIADWLYLQQITEVNDQMKNLSNIFMTWWKTHPTSYIPEPEIDHCNQSNNISLKSNHNVAFLSAYKNQTSVMHMGGFCSLKVLQ